ncbi:MAG: hypothetical protein GQ569_03200 [Methylococcaceae bacterium]|nr:hypothetical protein [Methylococcaceae bacterium]
MNDDALKYLKLCLEVLSQRESGFDLNQLQTFLSEPETLTLIGKFSEQLNAAWDDYSQESEYVEEDLSETVDNDDLSTALSTSEENEVPEPNSKHEEEKETSEDETASLIETGDNLAEELAREISSDEVTERPEDEPEVILEKDDNSTEEVTEETPLEEVETPTPIPPTPKEIKMNPIMPPVRFKLPNATVNKAYNASLETIGDKVVTLKKIEGLDDLGLRYDIENNVLAGDPLLAGDHTLTIYYLFNEQAYTAQINLVINNDPKSLWKNIPSDKDEKYWKSDQDNQGLVGIDEWNLLAASKRGRSHAHVGSCRDDDFALKVDEESHWHIAAVADGAGSSEYSREGARMIVNNSSEILTAQLQEHDAHLMELLALWQQDDSIENEQALTEALYDIFAPAITSSIDKLAEMAAADEKSFRDYYSTLLIAAHKPLATGSFCIAYWIGDGGLGIYKSGQSIKLLGDSDSGDYAGQTRFLDIDAKSPDDIKTRLRFSFDKDFTALVLMTDGISDPLFETDNNLKQLEHWDVFWSNDIQPELAENPETSAAQLENWLDFWSQGNHDDRTIALIYR